tara:strand:- start:2065 stop:2703 length:639 start_codon:yes stop_codon:yes gene_type:complete
MVDCVQSQARENLAEAIKKSAKDLQSLSIESGKNRAYLHQYVSRGIPRYLPVDVAMHLAEVLDIDWRVFVSPKQRSLPVSRKSVWVEEIDAEAAAGAGAMLADSTKIAEWGFPSGLDVQSSTHRIITVTGDSMEPVLRNGDHIMVDTSSTVPTPPGIFVLYDGIGVLVKRLEHIPGSNRVIVKSANPDYESYEQSAADLEIQGRVVWYGRFI